MSADNYAKRSMRKLCVYRREKYYYWKRRLKYMIKLKTFYILRKVQFVKVKAQS